MAVVRHAASTTASTAPPTATSKKPHQNSAADTAVPHIPAMHEEGLGHVRVGEGPAAAPALVVPVSHVSGSAAALVTGTDIYQRNILQLPASV